MFLKNKVNVSVVDTILENLIKIKSFYVYIESKERYINLFLSLVTL